jgi:hypothetical protein
MRDDERAGWTFPVWTWRVTNYSMPSDPDQPQTEKVASWVRCAVEGQPGAVVRLVARDPTPDQETLTAEAGSRPDYGPDVCELGPVKAGWYRVEVQDIDAAVDLWLDGLASAAVTFVPVRPMVPVKPADRLPHVLLLGQLMAHQGNFLALTRYVAAFGATVTFDPQEAARAEHAILIGAPQLVSAEVEQQLRMAGVRVERAQGDIAAQLDAAIEAGDPFLFS